MTNFVTNIVYSFLISFGVIIGASSFAGIGALMTNNPPLRTMLNLAESIKIWAVATSLGGTFSSFQLIEEGIFRGELGALIKQIVYILFALIGANLGYKFIKLVQKCGEIWLK